MKPMMTIKYLCLGTSSAMLSHTASGSEISSKEIREQKGYFMNAKPTPYLAFGAGLETGYYTSSRAAFGLNAEFDHYLVGGSLFLGTFGRSYLGNSFFAQAGLGYSEFFFHDWIRQGAGAHVAIGNEWQTPSGFVVGADWAGATFCSAASDWSPSFPKLRVGIAF
jgi:hypothetical protein